MGVRYPSIRGDEHFMQKRGLEYFKREWGRVFDLKGEQSLWRGEGAKYFKERLCSTVL